MRNQRWLIRGAPALLVWLFLAGVLMAAEDATVLDLVKDGKAVGTIVIPDGVDPWTKMAAGWIQEYVEKSSNAKLRIVPESDATGKPLIAVGRTRLAERAGIGTADLEYDGYKILAKENVVYVIGRDTEVDIEARPGEQPQGYGVWSRENVPSKENQRVEARGTCKAAVNFLQKVCGVRWLAPTPAGEHVPRKKDISVPADLRIVVKTPAFAYFIGGQLYGSPASSPAAVASNMLCPLKIRHYGGHSVPEMLPASKYFKVHPEYFALINGKRTAEGNHICTSNPEVRRILLKAIQADFDKGYDWVEFNYADGYKPCECEVCSAMDDYRGDMGYDAECRAPDKEHPVERLHLTNKWLADELIKSHPDKTLLLLAYNRTILPSRKFDKFPDNVVVEVTRQGEPQYLAMWRGRARGMTVYTCWFDPTLAPGFGALRTPQEVSRYIRYYHDVGVIGFFTWIGGGGFAWGLQGPGYYVLCQMVGDPTLKYEDLVKEYCRGLYGEAAEEMSRFFKVFYSRSLKSTRGAVPNSTKEMYAAAYSPMFIKDCDRLLREAERAAKTGRSAKWIRMTRDEFDYVKYLTNMIFLQKAYEVSENLAVLEEWKKTLDEFNAYRRRITAHEGEDVRLYFPGHGRLCKWLTSGINQGSVHGNWPYEKSISEWHRLHETGVGFYHGAVGMPITLRYEPVKKGTGLRVKYAASPPSMDGVLDEQEWKKAAPVSLSGAVPTEARAMYDDRNLYVAFDCDEPLIGRIKVGETVRDGAIWDMDCVELFLSPKNLLSYQYYHFIVAPSKDALYDDRTGFKTRTSQDSSWDAPGLRYGHAVDEKGKRWVIEMVVPFEDLGIPAPRPGDVWRGNLTRERYAGKGGQRQLCTWSGGGQKFCTPENFAKIVFEKP